MFVAKLGYTAAALAVFELQVCFCHGSDPKRLPGQAPGILLFRDPVRVAQHEQDQRSCEKYVPMAIIISNFPKPHALSRLVNTEL